MSKKRPNKQKCIDIIADRLDSGIRYTDCWEEYGKLWGISDTTFDIYWKEANRIYRERQEAIENAQMEERIRLGKEAVKREIMTRNEVLETLTKLGKGEAWKVGSEIIAPTASERINAMKEISRMQGYNKPEEVEVKGGLDVEVNASQVVKDILKKLND